MSPISYFLSIGAALLTLFVVIELLRRRRLRERHAAWWVTAGVLALITSIFPATLEWLADLVGVAVPTNLVFFVSIAVLVLVGLQHSGELTRAEARLRDLAEEVALLRLELEDDRAEKRDGTP